LLTRHWINWQEFKTIELADALINAGLKHQSKVKICPLGIDPAFISQREHRASVSKVLWWFLDRAKGHIYIA
jgi:hypothetical protein